MYHRSLYDIVMETGRSIGVLTREMQGEDELFASALTLRAVEARLDLHLGKKKSWRSCSSWRTRWATSRRHCTSA